MDELGRRRPLGLAHHILSARPRLDKPWKPTLGTAFSPTTPSGIKLCGECLAGTLTLNKTVETYRRWGPQTAPSVVLQAHLNPS